jgi:hypothetical protein
MVGCAMAAGLRVLLAASGAQATGSEACTGAAAITALPFTDTGATTCGFANDANNTGAAACADLPDMYPGPDVFYALTLGAGNNVAFDLTMPAGATGDLALFLLAVPTCGGAGQCAAYSIDVRGAGQGPERIKASSYPPGTYYVVVDSVNAVGASGSCGQYSLSVTGSLGAVTVPDGGADGGVHVDAAPHDVVAMDVISSDIGGGSDAMTDVGSVTDASSSDTSGTAGSSGAGGAGAMGGSGGQDAGAAGMGGAGGTSHDAGTDKPKHGGGSDSGCAIAPGAIAGGPSARQLGLAWLALVLCVRRRRRR